MKVHFAFCKIGSKFKTGILVQRINIVIDGCIVFEDISKEIHAIDTCIVEVSYGRILKSNFDSIDTIPTFYIKWKEETIDVDFKNDQIQNWLLMMKN